MKVEVTVIPTLHVELRVVNDDGSRPDGHPDDASGVLVEFHLEEIHLLERGALAPLPGHRGGGPGFHYAAYRLDGGAAALLLHLRALATRPDVIFVGPSEATREFVCPRCGGRRFGSREDAAGRLHGICTNLRCGFTWPRSDDAVVMTHTIYGPRKSS